MLPSSNSKRLSMRSSFALDNSGCLLVGYPLPQVPQCLNAKKGKRFTFHLFSEEFENNIFYFDKKLLIFRLLFGLTLSSLLFCFCFFFSLCEYSPYAVYNTIIWMSRGFSSLGSVTGIHNVLLRIFVEIGFFFCNHLSWSRMAILPFSSSKRFHPSEVLFRPGQ